MWIEGVRLMVVGMTTVFAFLGLLVAAMHLQAAVVARWLTDDDAPRPPPPGGDDDAELAVVLAVVAARHGRS